MMKTLLRYSLLGLILAFTPLIALPPPVPSAGVVEREIEKEYEPNPLDGRTEVPNIQIDMPDEKLNMPDGKMVRINEVQIRGNDVLDAKDFNEVIEPYLNRDLSLQQIYMLCRELDTYYCRHGYFLARCYPPPQDIRNGVLTIEVIEGKLGNVTIVGTHYYSQKFVASYFQSLQDSTLQYDEFMKALLLLNENSDLRAGAIFEKGKEFGYADVIIQVQDGNPRHLYLNGNNYGRKLTTNTRLGGRVDWGNYLTEGDTFSVAEVLGLPFNALYFTDVTYRVPLNRKGTFLELGYLYSGFTIEEYTELGLKGRSQIVTVKVSQAVVRKRYHDINVFSYFDYKQIRNFTLNQVSSFDALRVINFGAFFDFYDPCKARNTLTLRMGVGIPDFMGGSKAVDDLSSRVGGGGRFIKFNADYEFLKNLYHNCYFYARGSGQLSPSKLTQPEQLYIGGSDTVRGFPLAVALGDSGYYFNLELRAPPPGGNKQFFRTCKTWKDILQFSAFFDTGGVYLNAGQNTYLSGAGLGVKINGPYNFAISIDVGVPLNHKNLTQDLVTYIKVTGRPF